MTLDIPSMIVGAALLALAAFALVVGGFVVVVLVYVRRLGGTEPSWKDRRAWPPPPRVGNEEVGIE